MTANMQCSILQINRVFGRVNIFRDFHLFHKCLSRKLSYPGSIGNFDDDIIMEDVLEEKINRPSGTKPGFETKKRKSTKKELELQQRRCIKRKIIEKKERALYGEKRPRLLTWAARSQIKYLNKTDPIYWTPDMLAQSFPVSQEGIIRILKKKHLPLDEEYVHEYDRGVYTNWLRLKQAKQDFIEGKPVDPEFRSIVESEDLSLMKNAAGSLTLPIPETGYLHLTQKAIAEKRRPETKGEFSAILEDYEKDKEAVKKEKKVKRIELEDPDYAALLTGLSEMRVNKDIHEENTHDEHSTHYKYHDIPEENTPDEHSTRYKYHDIPEENTPDEHSTRYKYQDTKLFYDEYEDNLDIDVSDNEVYNSKNKANKFTHNPEKLTENRNEELNQSAFFNQKQKFSRKNLTEQNKKETDFQKNIAKWVKESSKELKTNLKKVRK